ncbi:FAD-dependent oxidoreductase [Bacillus sp. ISL-47]|uniref:NAD(P)/FAD-dependent oxidoreductase n=1 Tax=Bacillus sp. ISL-47 TaxID=2819130 RepID=UPI001BEAB26B|nr:FAD-dependent oxidoreductase [Bacillus sp. ISL-47]MBT2686606.1 FAD-dependent oxidoreductase [Bacillus sp. ISL-47]MBT2706998.1 FAD-dependent oxidoreductase [Pseudomonas sp. ISL-84]
MTKAMVIGGGIIGLASAFFLRKKGMEVVLIDKGEPGAECSSGNMGWVCPSLSDPVPAPGLVKTSLKWMLKRDSPLYIKPSIVPSLSPWLLQFWKFCSEDAYQKGYKAGLELSRNTLRLFDELEQESGLEFESHRKGLLFVFLKESYIEEKLDAYRIVEEFGLPAPAAKSKNEVLQMEPALSDAVAGGIYLSAERHVRPESLTGALTDWLVANGTEILSRTEVKGLIREGDQIVGASIGEKTIEGDHFLVTAGAWTGQILNQAGIPIPMTAGKGYSLTISSPSIQFQQPLYLGDSRVTISPFDHSVRIGGTMELSGLNSDLDQRRIDSLRSSAAQYLRSPIHGKERAWCGMRPMTPDGLPVMGIVPSFSNLFIASGHAMSGISMALSTGSVMSDLIASGKSDINLSPFAPDRFKTQRSSNKVSKVTV